MRKRDNKKTKIEGLWEKCPECQEILYKNDIEQNLQRCPYCEYYFSMSAKERIALLIDEDTFQEMDIKIESKIHLNFQDTHKNIKSRRKTGLSEGVISGIGDINGIKVSIAVMDFDF